MRHTVVIGGGIAGLSIALALAREGARRVTVIERETLLGTQSSARNAQIWLPVDDDETTGPLAVRSAAIMNELLGSEAAWLRRGTALVFTPDEEGARSIERGALRGAVRARRLDVSEIEQHSPAVRRTSGAADELALLIEGAGIFDPHAMLGALERACRGAGVTIETRAGAASLRAQDRVRAVELDDGRELPADEAVIAAGAWSGALGAAIAAPVPLVPLRRHLVVLEAETRRAGTIVWRFGAQPVYYRPEAGGVLASPCDEQAVDAGLPPADPAALEHLARVLAPLAPELVDAPVRTSWACLRTYAHDRELVLGPDPRVEGLAWMAGFGGRGMTVAVGAGELCAAAMNGARDPRLAAMRPDRAQPDRLIDPSS